MEAAKFLTTELGWAFDRERPVQMTMGAVADIMNQYSYLLEKLKSQTRTPETIAEALPNDEDIKKYIENKIGRIDNTEAWGMEDIAQWMRQQAIEKLSGKIVVPPTTKEEGKWISVEEKDRLPKTSSKLYIIINHDGVNGIAHYYENNLWFGLGAKFHTNGVTLFTPLPLASIKQ